MTFHVVIDARGLREGAPLLIGGDAGGIEEAANRRDGFVAADTLADLAGRAGIDPVNLVVTVADYNDALVDGRPDPFGRGHRPASIAEPPFYALRNHGTTVITFAGVDIDASFAVRDPDGAPIPGLYAVGEVIGAGATMGNAFCGGMTLTPALAFGRDLGQRLAAETAPR
jgi:fumarate reductase flavoprotein subunit